MFVKRRISWLDVATFRGAPTLKRIRGRLIFVVAVATATTVAHEYFPQHPFLLTPTPFTILGLALGIFLAFRNNASYDRWWEGRKLWGALVNHSFSLARQVSTLVGPVGPVGPGDGSPEDVQALRRGLVYRHIAFVHALRIHLREEEDLAVLAPLLPPDEFARLPAQRHRPLALLHWQGEALRDAWHRGLIHTYHLPVLEGSLIEITNVLGACDRIKNTPIPFPYSMLLHRMVWIFCLLLPIGIIDSLGRWTPFIAFMIAYGFLGLDDLADDLEDPFSTAPAALPLSAISRNIEIHLRQRLGEADLPAGLQPVDDVLM